MSGPIVRTGTTPKFWENWDNVFGKGKKPARGSKASAKKASAAGKKKVGRKKK